MYGKFCIYLETYGQIIAVVQSYIARGYDDRWDLELTKVYLTDDTIQRNANKFLLEDVSLVIYKNDSKIIYSNCFSTSKESDCLELSVCNEIVKFSAKMRSEEKTNESSGSV